MTVHKVVASASHHDAQVVGQSKTHGGLNMNGSQCENNKRRRPPFNRVVTRRRDTRRRREVVEIASVIDIFLVLDVHSIGKRWREERREESQCTMTGSVICTIVSTVGCWCCSHRKAGRGRNRQERRWGGVCRGLPKEWR